MSFANYHSLGLGWFEPSTPLSRGSNFGKPFASQNITLIESLNQTSKKEYMGIKMGTIIMWVK